MLYCSVWLVRTKELSARMLLTSRIRGWRAFSTCGPYPQNALHRDTLIGAHFQLIHLDLGLESTLYHGKQKHILRRMLWEILLNNIPELPQKLGTNVMDSCSAGVFTQIKKSKGRWKVITGTHGVILENDAVFS